MRQSRLVTVIGASIGRMEVVRGGFFIEKEVVIISYTLLITFATMATWTDIKAYKISNRLLVVMAAGGLILFLHHPSLEVIHLLLVNFLVFYVLYLFGAIGAGDVKFITLAILYMDQEDVMIFLSTLTICLGVVGLVSKMLSQHIVKKRLPGMPFMLLAILVSCFYAIKKVM